MQTRSSSSFCEGFPRERSHIGVALDGVKGCTGIRGVKVQGRNTGIGPEFDDALRPYPQGKAEKKTAAVIIDSVSGYERLYCTLVLAGRFAGCAKRLQFYRSRPAAPVIPYRRDEIESMVVAIIPIYLANKLDEMGRMRVVAGTCTQVPTYRGGGAKEPIFEGCFHLDCKGSNVVC